MARVRSWPVFFTLTLAVGACATRAGSPVGPAPLPLPPLDTTGPVHIAVVYPRLVDTGTVVRTASRIASRDSAFLFGSIGRGDATLEINGTAVPVFPNGTWIAWLPLPTDTVADFALVARAGDMTERLRFTAALVPRFTPPPVGPWIDTTSLHPTGDRWVRPDEPIRLRARASPTARVQLRVNDSTVIPMVLEPRPGDVPWGERAFGTVPPRPPPAGTADRYAIQWVGALGPDPGHPLVPDFPTEPTDAAWAWLEAIAGADTARVRWPLRVGVIDVRAPPVVVVHDDTAGTGATDRTLAGRPAPYGTYHWFFPNGTVAPVSGRWNDQIRLQLSRQSVAWVNAEDVQLLRPGTVAPGGTTQPLRLFPADAWVTLRIPLPGRVPFRVDEEEDRVTVTAYNVAANADWIQYGGTDPFVRLIEFAAPAEDETAITVHLAEPVWGYRTRWSGDDLLLDIRRPPPIDARDPFGGLRIALDPGHPPAGATGPSGAYEGDVVLAVARKARSLLEETGAQVVLLRDDTLPVSLVERVVGAERAEAHLLVSIHANALPDGVNPFVNNGTSVYYFHPRSAPLARAVNRALVNAFGFRDLGIGRGDLALARPTWMPAILTEGLFMMLPEQEAVLTSEAGQWRYARGVVDGLRTFLLERARAQP